MRGKQTWGSPPGSQQELVQLKRKWLPLQAVEEQGNTRGLNRHRYSVAEAEQELERPVVKALLEMCRFRNSHPAFDGLVSPPEHQATL